MACVESSSFARSGVAVSAGYAGGRHVVCLRGELDIATMAEVTEVIARAVLLEDGDVVLDLSDVRFMDASTVSAIVGARILLERRSRSLTVQFPSPTARRVLDLCGMTDLIDSDPNPRREARTSGPLALWVGVPNRDRVALPVDALSSRKARVAQVSSAGAHHRNGELTPQAARRTGP